jgi:hypothetical protein
MIVQGLCHSAKQEFLDGVHAAGDVYMIALYADGAALSAATKEYTATGEVGGKGYTPGGQILGGRVSGCHEGSGWIAWKDSPFWPNSTIAAAGALIYNKSKQNRAIAVFDFGEVIRSTNGPFRIPLPPAGPSTAIIYYM